MKAEPKAELDLISVIPVNEKTRAVLAYADRSEGRAKIEKARQEIRDGKGIVVTHKYRDELNRRISRRVAKRRSGGE
jgi:hypothetical protein